MALISDTSKEAQEVQFRFWAAMTPSEKYQRMASFSRSLMEASRNLIDQQQPSLDDSQRYHKILSAQYGEDLADKVTNYLTSHPLTIAADMTAALQPVVDALNELNIDYYVSGSVASSVFGSVRATNDIDLVVLFPKHLAQSFYDRLHSQYYIDVSAIHDAIRFQRSFNIVHLPTAIKLDLFICTGRSPGESAFIRAKTLAIDPTDDQFKVKFASPEDLILAKLQWYQQGGRSSNQQIQDIEGIVRVQNDLDRDYLERVAQSLGLTDLLVKVFP